MNIIRTILIRKFKVLSFFFKRGQVKSRYMIYYITARHCPDPGLGYNAETPRKEFGNFTQAKSDRFYFGDALKYTCLIGFEIGYNTYRRIVCGATGMWSEQPPRCHSKYTLLDPNTTQRNTTSLTLTFYQQHQTEER